MASLTHEELSPSSYSEQWCIFAAQVSRSMLTMTCRLTSPSIAATPAALEGLLAESQEKILRATDTWQATRAQRTDLFRDTNHLIMCAATRLSAFDAQNVPEALALKSKRGALYERAHEHWRQNAEFAGSSALCNAAIYKWFTDEERAGAHYVDEFDLRACSDLAQTQYAPHTVRNLGGAAYLSSVKV